MSSVIFGLKRGIRGAKLKKRGDGNMVKKLDEIYFNGLNKKLKQQIELLYLNKNFIEEADIIRKKWKDIIQKCAILHKKIIKEMDNLVNKCGEVKPLDDMSAQKSFKEIYRIENEQLKIIENTGLNKDLIELCRWNKLYPFSLWQYPILSFIISGKILPKMFEENFGLDIRENKKTGEFEYFIQIYPFTSKEEIVKNWDLIEVFKNGLREEVGLSKRPYPLKNLEKAKKILSYKKKQIGKSYKDPATGKFLKPYKETDFDVAENVLEESSEKAKNKVKDIRYKIKKKLRKI